MMDHAARPTARIANAVKRNTRAAPMNPPMNVSGCARSTAFTRASDRNALNRRNAARAALPTAYPFVRAFVVLPAASSLSMFLRAASDMPAISMMPAPLSTIGPKVSIARM